MSIGGSAKLARPSAEGEATAEAHELEDIVVGKDVLELVSSAMYIDPMTIYREYVQNAADAVDAARAEGTLASSEMGRVDIAVDPASRTVRIRDNGCGIAFAKFGRRLTSFGASTKRGTAARGFRGVGRLAGLGYAQELIFRSRVAGERKVSELRWDCRRLKALLRDDDDLGVADLIRSVTSLRRVSADDAPERFFEVEMRGIVRLRNDRLLSPHAIGDYLSQVAPVPFSPDFRFGEELTTALAQHCDMSALDIRIDDAEQPLYRPHRDRFSLEEKQDISFDSLTLLEIPGVEGDIAAVGWVLHHEYEGAVPTGTLVKGLRLRAGNIQVGDHALLEELFPEARFNVWSVGEIHVLDRRIVPNGRRDHFEQNAHFHNMLNQLLPCARDIARRCRTSSVRRKWEREFAMHARIAGETLDVIAQGGVGRAARDRAALSVEQVLLKMEKVSAMDLLAEGRESRDCVIEGTRTRLGELMQDAVPVASPLMRLPPKQRKLYENFFELVYECSVNRVAAKSLIDRIMMRLE